MIVTIYLKQEGEFYRPVSDKSKLLMQHCIGEQLELLNEKGLQDMEQVAIAHGWAISTTKGTK